MLPPKAQSVTQSGAPDGWTPPRCFRVEVTGEGETRLVVSVPTEELPAMHLRLLESMGDRVGLLYVRLTDRRTGAQLPKPERRVAMELPTNEVISAMQERAALIWHDGRHQLWVRGKMREQLVLDELGMLYCYPDDPSFRDALGDLPQRKDPTMDTRDYVKVNFVAEADEQERTLWERFGMREWG